MNVDESLNLYDEKMTMFKCPRDKTLNEMSAKCSKCRNIIEYYESVGYSLEALIVEVS